ncbi:hypothetical protein POM88_020606 [Heracleum sosnowskyi]|uniref:Replication protein A 70 kDa DNA-binding subunit B/D first OB fold domain-containing protein n=1 Tax=Heracleum sosnowskyi TaxID=360622 RepID=A0AAD8ID95_9APIA|nr:hypothetical protein POM88_020606 [Heracleum sosnowskyi]
MSAKRVDPITSLKPGRYDYRIKVRVIRKWRGSTKEGEVFKAFNILLLDSMQTRIHAFVPGLCVDDLEEKMIVGKVYTIKNFTVQNYKATDIFRCVRTDRQLIFSKETHIEDVEENGSKIQVEGFDFYEHSQLRTLAQQKTYLTDVVGIVKKYEFLDLTNKLGKEKKQAKFIITDGSSNVKVIFWDEFGENFDKAMNEQVDKPVIVILSACKAGLWNDEVELSNVSATKFYVNNNHHSVVQLRKRMNQPKFVDIAMATPQTRQIEQLQINQITKLGKEYIKSQVMLFVQIKSVVDTQSWFMRTCTTCDHETEFNNGIFICKNCPRTVPHPDTKYKIHVIASDDTGDLEVIMHDREVRTLIGRRARDVLDERGKRGGSLSSLLDNQHMQWIHKPTTTNNGKQQ